VTYPTPDNWCFRSGIGLTHVTDRIELKHKKKEQIMEFLKADGRKEEPIKTRQKPATKISWQEWTQT
jgi:hypothetical protein